jgi:hypothetical protein
MRARFMLANYLLDAETGPLAVPDGSGNDKLTPDQQVQRALDALGRPFVSAATRQALTDMAAGFFADLVKKWQIEERPERADMLQRILRHLILSGPDAHLH